MPAADLPTLFDFETQLESCVSSVLSSAGITLRHTSRDTADIVTPCVSVIYNHSGPWPTGATRMYKLGDYWIEDQFSGTIQIDVITDRNRNRSSHSSYRSKVRSALYQWNTTVTDLLLPYLSIGIFHEASVTQGMDPENNLDISTMSWAVVFAIKPTAWPS